MENMHKKVNNGIMDRIAREGEMHFYLQSTHLCKYLYDTNRLWEFCLQIEEVLDVTVIPSRCYDRPGNVIYGDPCKYGLLVVREANVEEYI